MSGDFSPKPLPELLAPAGSLEAFFAAMEKGADAVYAGLRDFSARAKAKNFTVGQLERMVAYAHSLDRRVLVTLNTLVKERELPQLVETLAALEKMGADGVIVQDLAVARLAREFFPALPLHASTQMTVHNTAGAQELALLGFKRVVLARELHLDEIRNIIKGSPLEVECFIHGALCFSFSGQCYFSSLLGGHSGNRGRCTQPCRRQYRYKGKEGYYFSTNDFSSIDLVRQLVDMGVASLKIEGRMKSAEYVASVVEAYRMVLDAEESKVPEAIVRAKELLKLSFGRVPTKGFLVTRTPHDISTPSLKGATGRFLGELKTVKSGSISFETKDRLHVGDRIRVQPASDQAGKAFTIKELFVGRQPVKMAKERTVVTIPSPFAFKVGDTVFKVSSETAFTMSENACLRRLDAVRPGRLPCRLTVALAGDELAIDADVAGASFSYTFPVGHLEPSSTADMAGVLQSQFAKCGDTRFELRGFAAPDFPRVLLPAARLKDIRRRLYERLEEDALQQVEARRRQAKDAALASLCIPATTVVRDKEELLVRVGSVRDLSILHQEGVDGLILPISRANLHQLPPTRKPGGVDRRIIWSLPFVIFDDDVPAYAEAVRFLHSRGYRRFELNNMAHFVLVKGLDCELSTGYRLFSLNSQALQTWQELGCSAAALYIEDDQDNVSELLGLPLAIRRRAVLYGPVPVITSRIIIKGVKSDAPVVSDRGDGYLVSVREGLSTITADKRFSICHYRHQLREAGCTSFEIDLSLETPRDRLNILDACRRGVQIAGTTEFNFIAGLV